MAKKSWSNFKIEQWSDFETWYTSETGPGWLDIGQGFHFFLSSLKPLKGSAQTHSYRPLLCYAGRESGLNLNVAMGIKVGYGGYAKWDSTTFVNGNTWDSWGVIFEVTGHPMPKGLGSFEDFEKFLREIQVALTKLVVLPFRETFLQAWNSELNFNFIPFMLPNDVLNMQQFMDRFRESQK